MTEQPPSEPPRPRPGDPLEGGGEPASPPPPPPPAAPAPGYAPPQGAPVPPQPPGAVPPGYTQPPAPAGGAGPVVGELAIKRGVGRVIGFSILSFGIYTYYWFYVTRKQLNSELGSTDDAGLYTAGLLVPILNIIITYWLWRDLNLLRQRVGLPDFNVILWLVLSMFIPFAALIIYPMVVNRLNEYWDVRTQGAAVTAPVTTGEKIVVGIGIALWAFFALIIIIAIVVAAAAN
jgi:hypothetical protein